MVEELFEVFEELFERRKKKKKKQEREQSYRSEAPARPKPAVFCLQCGTRNEGDHRFCLECGELLPSIGEEMRCLKCNGVVPITAKICGRCGARVAPA